INRNAPVEIWSVEAANSVAVFSRNISVTGSKIVSMARMRARGFVPIEHALNTNFAVPLANAYPLVGNVMDKLIVL
uniref:Uncharacterized protein n=1 Tax=Acrobeloides nanus TaxID=290746 RepID=A0A914DE81_9BILA